MKKTTRKQVNKRSSKTKSNIKPSRWKHNLLAIAIAIVLTAFIFYGIFTFYDYPDSEEYCKEVRNIGIINSSEECIANNGEWTSYPMRKIETEYVQEGYCDLNKKCWEEFNDDMDIYRKNVFFISVIVGLLVLIGGIFVSNRSVSGGLMGGGILTLIFGILQYWNELGDVLRFLLLGVVLAILIYIGVKKLRE